MAQVLGAQSGVRIRISREHPGEIDGMALGALRVGRVYEVPATIGTYLVAIECAEPVMDSTAPVAPLSKDEVCQAHGPDGRSVAADRGRSDRESTPPKP